MNGMSRREALGGLIAVGAAGVITLGFNPTAPSLVSEAQAQVQAKLPPKAPVAADQEEELAWDQHRRLLLELDAHDD